MSEIGARLRDVLVQRALDLASAEPTLSGVEEVSGRWARLKARARRDAADLLGAAGFATRADHAQTREELARLTAATVELTEVLRRLERRLPDA